MGNKSPTPSYRPDTQSHHDHFISNYLIEYYGWILRENITGTGETRPPMIVTGWVGELGARYYQHNFSSSFTHSFTTTTTTTTTTFNYSGINNSNWFQWNNNRFQRRRWQLRRSIWTHHHHERLIYAYVTSSSVTVTNVP